MKIIPEIVGEINIVSSILKINGDEENVSYEENLQLQSLNKNFSKP